jgi:hypothetical protein
MTRAGAVVVLLALAGCGTTGPGGAASCAGPAVSVRPTTVAAGNEMRVEGARFFADCYDTGQTGTPPAMRSVEIRLVTTGATHATVVLAVVDAEADGTFATSVQVPDDVPAGLAHIEAGGGEPAVVVVTAP